MRRPRWWGVSESDIAEHLSHPNRPERGLTYANSLRIAPTLVGNRQRMVTRAADELREQQFVVGGIAAIRAHDHDRPVTLPERIRLLDHVLLSTLLRRAGQSVGPS